MSFKFFELGGTFCVSTNSIISIGIPCPSVCPRSIISNVINMLVSKLGLLGRKLCPYKHFGAGISYRTQIEALYIYLVYMIILLVTDVWCGCLVCAKQSSHN